MSPKVLLSIALDILHRRCILALSSTGIHRHTTQPNPHSVMDRSGPCPSQLDADSSVRSTDSDALVSRSSAATLGYFSDPFASLFLPPALRRSPVKRPPLINIGTHARTWAVDRLVQDFLLAAEKLGKPAQVLSVGAGTDTRYWRMRKAANDAGTEWRCRKWVEIDFVEATSTKARVISMKNELKTALGGPLKIGAP